MLHEELTKKIIGCALEVHETLKLWSKKSGI